MGQHDLGLPRDARDRRDVAGEIEAESLIERRIGCVGRADEEERIAVWRCPDDRFRCDIAAASWPVLNDKGLAKALRQPLADQPCNDVVPSAGGEAYDHVHWARRIGLGHGISRDY